MLQCSALKPPKSLVLKVRCKSEECQFRKACTKYVQTLQKLKTVGFYGLVVVATGVLTWPCCEDAMTIPAIAAAPSASGTMVSLSCACFTPAGFPAGSGLTAKAGEKIRLDARHAPITVVRNFIREPQ